MQELQGYITENYFPELPSYDAADLLPDVGAEVKPVLGALFILLLVSLGAAVLKAAAEAFYPGAPFTDAAVCLLCSSSAYGILKRAYDAVSYSFQCVSALMDSMTAVMCVSYGFDGKITSGASSVTALMFALQALRTVFTSVLFPLILMCFGVSLICRLGFDAGLSRVCRTASRAATLMLSAGGAVICAVLSYQTVITRSADGAALRAVKFASSSFVPVVGSSLSESAAAVSSALKAIRISAGTGGVLSVLALTLPSVAVTACCMLCMRAASFLCSLLGADVPAAFFDDCRSTLSILFAADLSVCVIFTVACALFCL